MRSTTKLASLLASRKGLLCVRPKGSIRSLRHISFVTKNYDTELAESLRNPEEYWGRISENIIWHQPWQKVLDNSRSPFVEWFQGGKLSLCYNAVDRHVDEGYGDQPAIQWDSAITSKLGAVHSVVFGGFAAKELATRIKHAQPKVIISASCGIEPNRIVKYKPNVDEAIALAGAEHIIHNIVLQREEYFADIKHGDVVYQDAVPGTCEHDCVPVDAMDPLYILYTRVIEEYGVAGMFTAPTAIRAIKREDQGGEYASRYDLSNLRYLFVAGEHCDYDTRLWAEKVFKTAILDNWWQTETGHALTASCMGYGHSLNPPKDVSGKAVPGWDIKILKDNGEEAAPNELGRIVAKLPMPPGCMSTLFRADERFVSTYFSNYPGYYDTMDAGVKDQEGYIKVMARDDDVINVAGHRLSTSAIEEVLLTHPGVGDAAVVGVADKLKGQLPLGVVVPRPGYAGDLAQELVAKVRNDLGAVAAFRLVTLVAGLPRTRSGKTARKTIADLADGKQVKIPPTIEDPSVYKNIKLSLQKIGYAINAPDPQ